MRIKAPNIVEIGQRIRACGPTLYQKVEIVAIFEGRVPIPLNRLAFLKFRVAKRTHVPLSPAKFHMNRCNESPVRGENAHFWPVSKFNTGSLPLCGILPVTNTTFCTYSRRALFDLPKLCMVIELVVLTLKDASHF